MVGGASYSSGPSQRGFNGQQRPQQEALPCLAKDLSPFNQRWMLVARVTKRNSVRTFRYKAKDGEGQLFSIELLDREGGETRGTFFGAAVDTFYERLRQGGIFSFRGGRVKKADKRFCSCEHEITFDENSVITAVEDTGDCPQMVFDFKPLASLAQVVVGSNVDVAGVLVEVEQVMDVNLKAGGTKRRLNVTLLDDSNTSVRLTLWGEFAEQPFQEGMVALLKGVKLSDFGGRSLNSNFGSSIIIGEEAKRCNPRATALCAWYAEQGPSAKSTAASLSSSGGGGNSAPQTISEMLAQDATLESSSGGDMQRAPSDPSEAVRSTVFYHTIVPASVTFLPHERQPFYLACPAELPDERNAGKMRACNRKCEQDGDGWSCSAGHKCAMPIARWMLNFSIADHTGATYVSAFDDTARLIMSCEANDVAALWKDKDHDPNASSRIEAVFRAAQFKRWRLKLRSKKEVWNDEERVKAQLVECKPVPFVADGRSKLESIFQSVSGLEADASTQRPRVVRGGA